MTAVFSSLAGMPLATASAIILGIVEGLTEFLPISSTGHLILTQAVLRMEGTEVLKSFDIAIQLGAILAIVLLYGKRILLSRKAILLMIAGFIPTGIIGFLLHSIVRTYLLGNAVIVSWSLLIGGIVLLLFEYRHREQSDGADIVELITIRQALLIGCFQSIAIIPGVSRAAATIVGGLAIGLKRRVIVEYSFLLAIPTMLAATALDLLRTAPSMSNHDLQMIGIGFLTSFIVAILAVRWFLRFIQSHTFSAFGVYRIVVGLLFLWWM